MRRAIIVTRYTNKDLVQKYVGNKIYSLSDTENFVDGEMNIEQLKIKNENENLTSMSNQKQSDDELLIEEIKSAITHAFYKGFDEITLLCSLKKNSFLTLTLLSLYKIFDRVKLEVVDNDEAVSIYQKGTHIINKGIYNEIVLISKEDSIVSLEHASEIIKKVLLNNKLPYLAGIRFIDRIAVLIVEKGEIILIKREASLHA